MAVAVRNNYSFVTDKEDYLHCFKEVDDVVQPRSLFSENVWYVVASFKL